MIRVFAPAKINLALHVTGLRSDGYHILDMLVGFADVGDWLTIAPADAPRLTVLGGAHIAAPNIISRVADAFSAVPLNITLEKNLPVASGMGGGSADAAAAYRGILALSGAKPQPSDMAKLLEIGADVPMCVASAPAQVRGIGEQISPLPDMAQLHVVLVNPRVQTSTPEVFKALINKQNNAIAALPKDMSNPEILTAFLQDQRNDLQLPASLITPIIAQTLQAIARTGAQLVRMSGSGATCFGVYPTAPAAAQAARDIADQHPDWWIKPALLNGAPQAIRATT
jgi:4-diphosphocytidyl-2-C-methyl-D-erythritol kinase